MLNCQECQEFYNFSRIVIWLRPWGATWSKLKLTHAIYWSTHPIRHNSEENRRPHNSTNALHHNIGKAFQETDLEEGLKINIGWSLQSTFAPVTSPAVTAGLTWQPDTCPIVWARVATWKSAVNFKSTSKIPTTRAHRQTKGQRNPHKLSLLTWDKEYTCQGHTFQAELESPCLGAICRESGIPRLIFLQLASGKKWYWNWQITMVTMIPSCSAHPVL